MHTRHTHGSKGRYPRHSSKYSIRDGRRHPGGHRLHGGLGIKLGGGGGLFGMRAPRQHFLSHASPEEFEVAVYGHPNITNPYRGKCLSHHPGLEKVMQNANIQIDLVLLLPRVPRRPGEPGGLPKAWQKFAEWLFWTPSSPSTAAVDDNDDVRFLFSNTQERTRTHRVTERTPTAITMPPPPPSSIFPSSSSLLARPFSQEEKQGKKRRGDDEEEEVVIMKENEEDAVESNRKENRKTIHRLSKKGEDRRSAVTSRRRKRRKIRKKRWKIKRGTRIEESMMKRVSQVEESSGGEALPLSAPPPPRPLPEQEEPISVEMFREVNEFVMEKGKQKGKKRKSSGSRCSRSSRFFLDVRGKGMRSRRRLGLEGVQNIFWTTLTHSVRVPLKAEKAEEGKIPNKKILATRTSQKVVEGGEREKEEEEEEVWKEYHLSLSPHLRALEKLYEKHCQGLELRKEFAIRVVEKNPEQGKTEENEMEVERSPHHRPSPPSFAFLSQQTIPRGGGSSSISSYSSLSSSLSIQTPFLPSSSSCFHLRRTTPHLPFPEDSLRTSTPGAHRWRSRKKKEEKEVESSSLSAAPPISTTIAPITSSAHDDSVPNLIRPLGTVPLLQQLHEQHRLHPSFLCVCIQVHPSVWDPVEEEEEARGEDFFPPPAAGMTTTPTSPRRLFPLLRRDAFRENALGTGNTTTSSAIILRKGPWKYLDPVSNPINTSSSTHHISHERSTMSSSHLYSPDLSGKHKHHNDANDEGEMEVEGKMRERKDEKNLLHGSPPAPPSQFCSHNLTRNRECGTSLPTLSTTAAAVASNQPLPPPPPPFNTAIISSSLHRLLKWRYANADPRAHGSDLLPHEKRKLPILWFLDVSVVWKHSKQSQQGKKRKEKAIKEQDNKERSSKEEEEVEKKTNETSLSSSRDKDKDECSQHHYPTPAGEVSDQRSPFMNINNNLSRLTSRSRTCPSGAVSAPLTGEEEGEDDALPSSLVPSLLPRSSPALTNFCAFSSPFFPVVLPSLLSSYSCEELERMGFHAVPMMTMQRRTWRRKNHRYVEEEESEGPVTTTGIARREEKEKWADNRSDKKKMAGGGKKADPLSSSLFTHHCEDNPKKNLRLHHMADTDASVLPSRLLSFSSSSSSSSASHSSTSSLPPCSSSFSQDSMGRAHEEEIERLKWEHSFSYLLHQLHNTWGVNASISRVPQQEK